MPQRLDALARSRVGPVLEAVSGFSNYPLSAGAHSNLCKADEVCSRTRQQWDEISDMRESRLWRAKSPKWATTLNLPEFTCMQNACVFRNLSLNPELIRPALIPNFISSNLPLKLRADVIDQPKALKRRWTMLDLDRAPAGKRNKSAAASNRGFYPGPVFQIGCRKQIRSPNVSVYTALSHIFSSAAYLMSSPDRRADHEKRYAAT